MINNISANEINILLRFLCYGVSIPFESCHYPSQKDKGEKLTKNYYNSCHLPVPPKMLDSITWADRVLPAMSPKLGIKV